METIVRYTAYLIRQTTDTEMTETLRQGRLI